jgi:hypothetical protein
MVTLVSVKKSPIKTKKWRALFSDGNHTDFGLSTAQDYTQHHDVERRRRYVLRHTKDLNTGDPTRAGYLSMYLLWGPSTNIKDNIEFYKKTFQM